MTMLSEVRKLKSLYTGTSIEAVCDFVLKNHTDLHHYTTQGIADMTCTSKSALVRFAQKLGYKGWKDFLSSLIEEEKAYSREYTDVDPNVPFTRDAAVSDIVQTVASLKVESILNTANLLAEKDVRKVVKMLYDANRVFIVGLSPNSPNLWHAHDFAGKMLQLGRIVGVPSETEKKVLAAALHENDVVMIISYNGRTKDDDTLYMLSILKNRHVPVIAVTGSFENDLRELADVVLSITSEENHYTKIASFSTGTSISLILDVVYACYFAMDYERNMHRKTLIDNAVESERTIPND